MTDKDTISAQISTLKKYLSILEDLRDISRDDLESDVIKRGAVERYTYLACQACIDLANSFISYSKLRRPSKNSESFEILKEAKIINHKLFSDLVSMTGFRNVLAHDYDDVDLDVVYEVLQENYKDVEKFLKIIQGQLGKKKA